MRKTLLVLSTVGSLLVSSHLVPTSYATFNTTNGETTIEIEDIDIAPTNTPTPLPGITKPVPTGPPVRSIPFAEPKTSPQERNEAAKQPSDGDFFSFTMIQSVLDFGVVDPTNPVIRTHDVRIDSGNAQGMSLFAYENHPLKVQNSEPFIPDTTCDDGQCTELASALWENTLTYGFGYRCDNGKGTDAFCASDFTNQQSYRQFADVSKKEVASDIISKRGNAKSATARITYKVNVPGTQVPGYYTNSVVYIATPTY